MKQSYRDHAKDKQHPSVADRPLTPIAVARCLHQMLERAEEDQIDHIIAWQPHGRSFVIHKPNLLPSLLPKYGHMKIQLTSIQRLLKVYGFRQIVACGADQDSYYHEYFLRGRSDLLLFLLDHEKDTPLQGTSKKQKLSLASSQEEDPDFWKAFPWVPPSVTPIKEPLVSIKNVSPSLNSTDNSNCTAKSTNYKEETRDSSKPSFLQVPTYIPTAFASLAFRSRTTSDAETTGGSTTSSPSLHSTENQQGMNETEEEELLALRPLKKPRLFRALQYDSIAPTGNTTMVTPPMSNAISPPVQATNARPLESMTSSSSSSYVAITRTKEEDEEFGRILHNTVTSVVSQLWDDVSENLSDLFEEPIEECESLLDFAEDDDDDLLECDWSSAFLVDKVPFW